MSGSRRIPISARPPGQGGAGHRTNTRQQQPAPAFPSSLDLVFSFFRTAPMASLPSSPSFVARYRRPAGAGGAGEDDDSSFAGTSSLAASETETDYDGEWSEGEDEVDPAEINSWDPAVGLDEPAWTRERVPKNAVRKPSTKRLGTQRDPSAESDPSYTYDPRPNSLDPPSLLSPPNERSALLSPTRRGRSLSPQAPGRAGPRAGDGHDKTWSGTISACLQVSHNHNQIQVGVGAVLTGLASCFDRACSAAARPGRARHVSVRSRLGHGRRPIERSRSLFNCLRGTKALQLSTLRQTPENTTRPRALLGGATRPTSTKLAPSPLV